MIEVHTIHLTDIDGVITCKAWDGENHEYLDLMQYTGLHDRHGKPIFEGDIVRENDRKNWEVKFDTEYGGFYPFTYCSDGLGYECGTVRGQNCEILGNIWENPELLNT